MFLQHGGPFVGFVVEKHVAFPLGLEQLFVGLGHVLALDHVGVVAEHDGDDVERREVTVFVAIRWVVEIALRREIGIDGADLLDRRRLLGGTVGDVEQMIAAIHFGLDFDHLAVAGDTVGIDLDEWIALLKHPDKRLDLLRLQRAIESHFALGFGLLDELLLALLGWQLVHTGKDLSGVFRSSARICC